jgi:hypothetical protein
MISPNERPQAPVRPVRFHAAESLGPFELAQLWADRTAWPIDERTAHDELAELAPRSQTRTVVTPTVSLTLLGTSTAFGYQPLRRARRRCRAAPRW